MSRLVMKFGGTSVANFERIRNVARHVKREIDAGHDVAVVVSAMSGKTERAGRLGQRSGADFDAREYDAIVASGELVTAGLLAMVLKDMGLTARSWQGWQIPILTDDAHGAARISRHRRFEDRRTASRRARSPSSPAFRACTRRAAG